MHFTFDNQVYQQNDGVAMGSPLGPVFAAVSLWLDWGYSNIRKYGF